jgi:hypothetical protein
MPIRIDRAVAAAAGDGGRAVITAVIFAVPSHNVAFVRDGAPLRVAGLIGEACPHVGHEGAGNGCEEERQLRNEDFHAHRLEAMTTKIAVKGVRST